MTRGAVEAPVPGDQGGGGGAGAGVTRAAVEAAAQVLAQAAGPLLSGVLYDLTGTYAISLQVFAALSALGLIAALAARPPRSA